MLNDREKDYINSICYHVRCKQAHPCIRKEIGDHIEDQREAFITEGMSPDAASEAAVREMGEAELVGGRMDKVYRPRISVKLLAVFVAILALGFVLRTISGVTDMKSILCFGFGAVMFFVILRFWNVGWMFEKAWWFIGSYAILMMLLPSACYALDRIGLLNVVGGTIPQTVYVQLLQPIVFAMFIWKLKGKGILGAGASLPFVIITLWPLLFESTHMYTALMMALIDLAVLLYVVAKGWMGKDQWITFGLICFIALLISIIFFAVLRPYNLDRLRGMLVENESFMYITLNDILENTELFHGVNTAALSSSTQEWLAGTPAYYSMEFMIVKLAALTGKWVYIAVILLLGGMIALSVGFCLRENTMLCKTMSLSIVGVIAVQCAGYIINNLGINFATLPFPFISYGNMSMIANMILMGMLFCILGKGWMYSDESMVSEEKGRLKMS